MKMPFLILSLFSLIASASSNFDTRATDRQSQDGRQRTNLYLYFGNQTGDYVDGYIENFILPKLMEFSHSIASGPDLHIYFALANRNDKKEILLGELTSQGPQYKKKYVNRTLSDDAQILSEMLDLSLIQNDPKPASSTTDILIFSNHGGGASGVISSAIYSKNGKTLLKQVNLRNSQASSAIQNSMQKRGKEKIDLIVFDACNMANLEAQMVYATAATLSIASEDQTLPSQGSMNWPRALAEAFNENKSSSDSSKSSFIKSFIKALKASDPRNPAADLSIIDLTRIHEIQTALESFMVEYKKLSENERKKIILFAKKDIESEQKNPQVLIYFYDLKMLFQRIRQASPNESIRKSADMVLNSLNRTIIFFDQSQFKQRSGLSIYTELPLAPDMDAKIEKTIFDYYYSEAELWNKTNWIDFLFDVQSVIYKDPNAKARLSPGFRCESLF